MAKTKDGAKLAFYKAMRKRGMAEVDVKRTWLERNIRESEAEDKAAEAKKAVDAEAKAKADAEKAAS
jgi:hypothetical protein